MCDDVIGCHTGRWRCGEQGPHTGHYCRHRKNYSGSYAWGLVVQTLVCTFPCNPPFQEAFFVRPCWILKFEVHTCYLHVGVQGCWHEISLPCVLFQTVFMALANGQKYLTIMWFVWELCGWANPSTISILFYRCFQTKVPPCIFSDNWSMEIITTKRVPLFLPGHCPGKNVTDLETGETLTHSPSRRTGTVTRPVRTGTGLLSAFLSVVAVMNSLGRPQGLPLIPETVSSPGVSATDEYDDVLGRHHEDCISSLSPKDCLTQELQHIAAHWTMHQITHCYQ